MKACESCQRISIYAQYEKLSPLRVFVGLLFVYGPAVFLPFILIPAYMIFLHLKLMGAKNIRSLSSFLPDPKTHRYSYKTQIVKQRAPKIAFWVRLRIYWIFNCKWYCPFSVATLEWFTYLVKAVENFWCPFYHSKVSTYSIAAIDSSYWHDSIDIKQLNPEDRDNPIWYKSETGNQESE